jgi:hypothetical protein
MTGDVWAAATATNLGTSATGAVAATLTGDGKTRCGETGWAGAGWAKFGGIVVVGIVVAGVAIVGTAIVGTAVACVMEAGAEAAGFNAGAVHAGVVEAGVDGKGDVVAGGCVNDGDCDSDTGFISGAACAVTGHAGATATSPNDAFSASIIRVRAMSMGNGIRVANPGTSATGLAIAVGTVTACATRLAARSCSRRDSFDSLFDLAEPDLGPSGSPDGTSRPSLVPPDAG